MNEETLNALQSALNDAVEYIIESIRIRMRIDD